MQVKNSGPQFLNVHAQLKHSEYRTVLPNPSQAALLNKLQPSLRQNNFGIRTREGHKLLFYPTTTSRHCFCRCSGGGSTNKNGLLVLPLNSLIKTYLILFQPQQISNVLIIQRTLSSPLHELADGTYFEHTQSISLDINIY
jgi:hypothetical protein